MATFTLTGTLLHDDGVTPVANSGINVKAAPYPDPTLKVLYTRGVNFATDANGAFSKSLITATGLYYTIRSTARTPLFQPIVFAAPAAGATVDLSSLTTYDPTGYIPNVYTDTVAAKNAAVAAAAGVQTNNWAATTAYVTGQIVRSPVTGEAMKARSSHTSGAAWDPTKWWSKDRRIRVREYGAKFDGSTDDTAAWAAAIADAWSIVSGTAINQFSGASKNTFPIIEGERGDSIITATLDLPMDMGVDLRGGTVRAGATIAGAMFKTRSGAPSQDIDVMRDGVLDCANLAQTGLWVRYANNARVRNVTVSRWTTDAYIFGDSTVGVTSYEMTLDNLHTYRPPGDAVPSGSRGLYFAYCSDSQIHGGVIKGADISVRTEYGGHLFDGVHSWNEPAQAGQSICFDDNGGNNQYIGCYPDNFTGVGWKFAKDGCVVQGGLVLHGQRTDNTGYAFDQVGVNPKTFVSGVSIATTVTNRLAGDWKTSSGLNNTTYIPGPMSNVVAITSPLIVAGGKMRLLTAGLVVNDLTNNTGGAVNPIMLGNGSAPTSNPSSGLIYMDGVGEPHFASVSGQLNASIQTARGRAVSVNTNVNYHDDAIIVTGASAVTITLVAANTVSAGRRYTVINGSSATVTVTVTAGGGSLHASATSSIAANGTARYLSDGSSLWYGC